MQKIISLFQRDYLGDRLVMDKVTPGAEWVVDGEGTATRKWDGTCCLIRDDVLYKRYEVKRGKVPPPGFEPATDVDPETGKQQGWLAVGDGPEDEWHREAFARRTFIQPHGERTYELVGPKVQGNPEGFPFHMLIPHGHTVEVDVPRDFVNIREYLKVTDIEGIVWHHPDGRMVKIKAKDFGLTRGRFGAG